MLLAVVAHVPAALVSVTSAGSVARRATESLSRGAVHVERRWVSDALVTLVRSAADGMVERIATTASFGGTNVDATVRDCATVDLLSDAAWEAMPPALCELIGAVDSLRSELCVATGRPLLEEAELQLLAYPAGGHYSRHIDDGVSTAHRPVRRSISMIVFLTDNDWVAETDGGALRVHCDERSPPFYDIAPEAGSLVLFDSSSVSHEVLQTARARLACVGWFLVER